MNQLSRLCNRFVGDWADVEGRLTVDFDFEHSLQVKSLIILFLILEPCDRNNLARDCEFR